MRTEGRVNLGLVFFLLSSALEIIPTVNAANQLKLRPEKTLVAEAINEEVFLWCVIEVEDESMLEDAQWIGPDGRTIRNETGKLLVDEDLLGFGLGLQIHHLQEDDLGIYRCSVTYNGAALPEVTVEVHPFRNLTWDAPQSQDLMLDSAGLIRCRVRSDPPATISWFRGNAPYVPDGQRCRAVTNGILCDPVTEDDAGRYTCRATRSDRSVQSDRIGGRSVWVRANVLPIVEDFVNDLTVTEGESVQLNCSATGSALTYKWYRKNVLVEKQDGYRVGKKNGTLLIRKVSEDDNGMFSCVVSNRYGDGNPSELHLKVLPKEPQKSNKDLDAETPVDKSVHHYGDIVGYTFVVFLLLAQA